MTRLPDASQAEVKVGDVALVLSRIPFPWRKRYLTKQFIMRINARQHADSYQVIAILQSGERVVLLDRLSTPNIAIYLRDRIRQRWE